MSQELLFDRRAVIIFGPRGEQGKLIEGLRVKFEIEKTLEPVPNKAVITVYNLNADSRALTERPRLFLALSVGYGNIIEDIFNGDISQPKSQLTGPDIITTFEVGDGEVAYQQSRVDITYTAGTSIKDAILGVARSFGQTIKDLSAVGPEKILNGLVLSGPSRQHLNQLTEKSGLEWSIQDGSIQVLKKGGVTNEEAVVLTPQTGLIGIPQKKDQGIELTSLLQTKLKPGRIVQVQSKFISGTFKCSRVTHKGDTHDKDWISVVEALPV